MKRLHAGALIAALVMAVYAQVLWFGFIGLDDTLLIVDNQELLQDPANLVRAFGTDVFDVRSRQSSGMYYRPLLIVTLMADAWIGGASPVVFHLTNVLLHVAACCLLLSLLLRLGYSTGWSLVAAAAFAVHPALVQAVAWVPGRNDSLLALLLLLSFSALLAYLDSGRPIHLVAHLGALTLALFSKETAVFFVPLAFAWVMMVGGSSSRRAGASSSDSGEGRGSFADKVASDQDVAEGRGGGCRIAALAGGWVIVVTLWLLARQLALVGRQADVGLGALLAAAASNLPLLLVYLGKALVPVELSVWHAPEDASLLWGLVAVVVLGAAAWRASRTAPARAVLGVAWFVVFLAPSLVVPILAGFEHRLYLPLVGLVIVLLEAARDSRIELERPRSTTIASVLVVALALGSFGRAQAFSDKLAFWSSAASTAPSSALARLNLGAAYMAADRLAEAERELRRALDLNPAERMVHNNLGIVYARQGRVDAAEAEFRAELALNPGYADGHFNLGTLLYEKGDAGGAAASWERALELDPDHLRALAHLARLHLEAGDEERARRYLEELRKRGLGLDR